MPVLSPSHIQKHNCTATLLCCMDFRFWKAVTNYIQNVLGIYDFDLITQAGAGKPFAQDDQAMGEKVEMHFGIAENLHHAKTIIVVQHEDCGAYGGSGKFESKTAEFDFQFNEIKKAVAAIQKKHPSMNILGFFAYFNANGGVELKQIV